MERICLYYCILSPVLPALRKLKAIYVEEIPAFGLDAGAPVDAEGCKLVLESARTRNWNWEWRITTSFGSPKWLQGHRANPRAHRMGLFYGTR